MTLPDPEAWPLADPRAWPARDLLAERAATSPDRTALLDADADERWTYAAYDRRVGRLAERLAAVLGDDGGRVGLLLGTRPAFAATLFATARLGRSLAPLNVELSASVLADQTRRADLAAVVCGRETADLARTVAPSGVPVASVDEVRDDDVAALKFGETDRETGASDERRSVDPATQNRDAERLVLFTSGTTGEPKGVRLTAGNLVASAVGSAFRLGVRPGDRWLVTLPAYHMGGLAPFVRATLYGTTAVVRRSFDAAETAAAMADDSVTGVSLVPTMLARLLDAGWTPPPSLRFVLLGGAPATDDLLRRCERHDVPVYPTYGTTETASQIATATPTEAFANPGTVGRPLDGTTVAVRDGDDPCPPGEPGELVVSGPTVSPGYLDDDHTAAAFDGDAFHTGDIGYRDEDGLLWVVGRVDDRIVTGGENVQPTDVADAIRSHPAIEDAAVVGLDDPEWGQRVAALVVADGLDAAAVREHCRERLAGFKRPKTIDFADALPRTASGTIDRGAVRERLRADADDG
ncbi:MAG: class I adenylate-forming enzyme family protein [Haloarculaceae archaeon]